MTPSEVAALPDGISCLGWPFAVFWYYSYQFHMYSRISYAHFGGVTSLEVRLTPSQVSSYIRSFRAFYLHCMRCTYCTVCSGFVAVYSVRSEVLPRSSSYGIPTVDSTLWLCVRSSRGAQSATLPESK